MRVLPNFAAVGWPWWVCRGVGVALALLSSACVELGITTPYVEGRCAVSPDGSKVYFEQPASTTASDIYSIANDGSGPTRLTLGPLRKGWPWVSPDGRSIVYVSADDRSSHISVMDMDGKHGRQLTFLEQSEIAPSYSPDGHKIIFARAARHRPRHWGGMTYDQWDIWQMNADGSAPQQLTHGRYDSIDAPCCSADGKHVIFGAEVENAAPGEAFRGTSHRLFLFDIGPDGSAINLRPVPLPPDQSNRNYDGDPSFSPDGSTIVFTSLRVSRSTPCDYEIWTAGVDGTKLRQLTHNHSRRAIRAVGFGAAFEMRLHSADE